MIVNNDNITQLQQEVTFALKFHMQGEFEVRIEPDEFGHYKAILSQEEQTYFTVSIDLGESTRNITDRFTRRESPLKQIEVSCPLPKGLPIEPAFLAGILWARYFDATIKR